MIMNRTTIVRNILGIIADLQIEDELLKLLLKRKLERSPEKKQALLNVLEIDAVELSK